MEFNLPITDFKPGMSPEDAKFDIVLFEAYPPLICPCCGELMKQDNIYSCANHQYNERSAVLFFKHIHINLLELVGYGYALNSEGSYFKTSIRALGKDLPVYYRAHYYNVTSQIKPTTEETPGTTV